MSEVGQTLNRAVKGSSTVPAAKSVSKLHAGGKLDSLCRDRFPILQRTVHGKPLVYLDSAATAQKPDAVIAAAEMGQKIHDCVIVYAALYHGVDLDGPGTGRFCC